MKKHESDGFVLMVRVPMVEYHGLVVAVLIFDVLMGYASYFYGSILLRSF
jgi:hypothetical protein